MATLSAPRSHKLANPCTKPWSRPQTLFSPAGPGSALAVNMPPAETRLPQLVIGILTPHTGGFYYGAVMNGILAAVRRNDAVAIAFEGSRLTLLKGNEVLASDSVDGWLAVNEFSDSALLENLRERGQPIVHLHSKPDVLHGSSVLPDNAGGASFVTRHLIEHGHRRIAFAGNLVHVDIGERYEGYRAVLDAHGIPHGGDLLFDTPDHKEANGRSVGEQLLQRREDYRRSLSGGTGPITALVAATDRLAMGAMGAFLDAGLELPRDFAVVGFDDADAAQFSEPPLTTVKQSFFEAAARAVEELLASIREGRAPVSLIRVPIQPMVRRSCGCVVSLSVPPSLSSPVSSREQNLTRTLLAHAGRNQIGSVVPTAWSGAEKIAKAVEEAVSGRENSEAVRGEWWSEFLLGNRDAESAVRVMELLEATLREWDQSIAGNQKVWGILRDLRVSLLLEWQRTERLMVAHYESVTEAAYRLANSLASAGVDASRDLSWIRWSDAKLACCAMWVNSEAAPDAGIALEVCGEYRAEFGAMIPGPKLPPIGIDHFPPQEIIEAAYEIGALVTVAGVPSGRDGRGYGVLAVVAPLAFEQLEYVGTPGAWAVQLGSSLDRAQTERDLRASTEVDALTGLPNRATLLERIEQLYSDEGRPSFALLLIDFDDFKKVNDSLGHLAGDQLLVQIAERLAKAVELRPKSSHGDPIAPGLLARLGGDEFVLVLCGIDNEEDAVLVVHGLQDCLKEPYAVQGSAVFVSASIGVVLGRGREASALDLLRDVDTAMYRAKVKGRARHEIFHHGMHKEALEKLELDARLRLALEHDELELWYQPIIEVATGWDVGAEGLIRWRHPEQGVLCPARFLAVAEDVGLAIPFSEWVIRRACSDLASWQSRGARSLYVNVNVPAAHVKQADFVEFVERALADHGLSPHSLGIEIVESTLLDEPEKSARALGRLMSLGVRVAIDDFGTGYSSLSYLRDFPASTLKVDRSFVMNLPGSSRDSGITKAIIAMGQGLGLSVVAEGIETPEQLEFLRLAGCDYVQGYLLSHPLERAAYVARLAQIRAQEISPSSSRRDLQLIRL